MKNNYLELLWDYIIKMPQSPSHDKEHLERVIEFAKQLQVNHGGDLESIIAAAMLHDIGRVDPKLLSKDSALVAADQAREILEKVGAPKNKIGTICLAIQQHDQPDFVPDTIEGIILKEADFLAGFGAWGILRTAMYQGERRKGINDVLNRLSIQMPVRIDHLNFPESKSYAQEEYLFVELFLSLLSKPAKLQSPFSGKYIAFEGISGSGKTSQIELLKDYLISLGKDVEIVSEPNNEYRPLINNSKSLRGRLHLFIADRYNTSQNITYPALKAGHIVLSSRSYLSSIVYQAEYEEDIPYIRFLHQELPTPDLIFLIDIPAETAIERILSRLKQSGEPLGINEKFEKLKKDKEKYLRASKDFNQVVVIDGLLSKKQITEQIIHYVDLLMNNKSLGNK